MGSRPAPARATTARTLAAAALLAAALPGCSAAPTPHAPPSPSATTPQELCTSLITHWARVILDGGQGEDAVRLDYQSMGLSGDQNEILRAVLDQARAEERDRGPDAARALAAREAARRCAERHRSGAPTGGPWG